MEAARQQSSNDTLQDVLQSSNIADNVPQTEIVSDNWQRNYAELPGLHQTFVLTASDQLYRRYPFLDNVRDLTKISRQDIKSICRFALSVTPVIKETWSEFIGETSGQSKENLRSIASPK
jgi:hypothetical protein